MPIFQLVTLLLLTGSHFSVRPSQPTATSALQLDVSKLSSIPAANDSDDLSDRELMQNLTERNNIASDFLSMFHSNNRTAVFSSVDNKLCENCSYPKRTLKSLSYRTDPMGLSEWPQDGVLPFYRIRSDLQRSAAKVVTILGLFEMSTSAGDRPEGRSELAAALLAIKHINQRKVLGEFQLRILTNDTKCDPGVGVDTYFHALYTHTHTRMPFLLGSGCSEVTESLAKITPYWNMVQVSFGSTSPALSDRREFPLFYRTAAPDSAHNPARLAFITRFGWETVTALSQNQDDYTLAVNDLVTQLEQANITCRATITFAENDFQEQLNLLKELDTRIIIGSFSHRVAPKIFCEAYKLGMFGADYVWILHGQPDQQWWRNQSRCSHRTLAAAVEGLILVSSHNTIIGGKSSISGLRNERFVSSLPSPLSSFVHQTYDAVWAIALALKNSNLNLSLYDYSDRHMARTLFQAMGNLTFSGISRNERFVSSLPSPLSSFVHQTYDAVWAIALALKNSNLNLSLYDYSDRHMARTLFQAMGNLTFSGISGPVSFSGADRVGVSAFYRVQGGKVMRVALFDPTTDTLDFTCGGCTPILWEGAGVPIAERVFKLRVVTIQPLAFLVVASLASVGITLACGFLAFNLYFRRLKYIKLSSPRLNNMAVVGCVLVYMAVILLGLDHATLPTKAAFPTVCTARVYLLSAGFSLAFGSMFTKTYRVHRIFTRSASGVVKNKLLQDTQLISLICVLLVVDGLIVTLWVAVDPMQRQLRNLTLEISTTDRSVVYQPQVEVCGSQFTHSWLGALYAYKGLLLIVGVYMAWETRHVKIPALNDSQYIGLSVYSVVITSALVVVLANLLSERATLAFVTSTVLILFSTTSSLCLLFLPKIHAILQHKDSTADPVTHSMGLKIECNTRRFLIDDRREVYYRVEVQNRVYRREITVLDNEIGKLERALSSDPSIASSSHSSVVSRKDDHQAPRAPLPPTSVSGTLPMLLLSVLPPVIPRASWPSAEHCVFGHGVTFSSEPKLDEVAVSSGSLRSQDGEEEDSGKLSMFGKLLNILGPRKSSSVSYTGGTSGIAAALKVHMGYIAGLVPTNKSRSGSLDSSSHSSRYCVKRDLDDDSSRVVSRLFKDDSDEENPQSRARSSQSLSHRVSFSIQHQHSQPALKVRGSPRFPHRIVPTCSLDALEERLKSGTLESGFVQRTNHFGQTRTLQAPKQLKCRSLEDASTPVEEISMSYPPVNQETNKSEAQSSC